jgi:hypothetical protein
MHPTDSRVAQVSDRRLTNLSGLPVGRETRSISRRNRSTLLAWREQSGAPTQDQPHTFAIRESGPGVEDDEAVSAWVVACRESSERRRWRNRVVRSKVLTELAQDNPVKPGRCDEEDRPIPAGIAQLEHYPPVHSLCVAQASFGVHADPQPSAPQSGVPCAQVARYRERHLRSPHELGWRRASTRPACRRIGRSLPLNGQHRQDFGEIGRDVPARRKVRSRPWLIGRVRSSDGNQTLGGETRLPDSVPTATGSSVRLQSLNDPG